MGSLEKEMAEFLSSNKKRYHKFLSAILDKYKSLGNIGGSIYIKNLNDEERRLLCKIDSKYISVDEAKISVKKFFSVFNNTKYSEADFVEVLKIYFKNDLKTNREEKQEKEREKNDFFNAILEEYKETTAYTWLDYALRNKCYGYNILIRQYQEDKKSLEYVLKHLLEAINIIFKDKEKKRLAIFSTQISKDPHYFDENKVAGLLLISALSYLSNIPVPEISEEKNELLYNFGLLKDEISNFTVCANVIAFSKDKEHIGIKGFYERGEPIHLNLWNLSNIEHIKCTQNVLYVFENPSVFSEVLLKTKDRKPSLLCTSGQLKLASLVFLDKVVQNADKIYYSGDIDPEGISIAYKLKQRYKDKLIYWRYDVSSYYKSKSNVKFDNRRKRQLETIEDEDLKQLVKEVLKYECSGYQEVLIEDYINDILNLDSALLAESKFN